MHSQLPAILLHRFALAFEVEELFFALDEALSDPSVSLVTFETQMRHYTERLRELKVLELSLKNPIGRV